MTKVKCSVSNCSYNKDHVCYAERVAIGGQAAVVDEATCCGTFLNEDAYSNLAEHTAYKSACKAVSCTVATCVHHKNDQCMLDCIAVEGSGNAAAYVETCCSSFKAQ
ncbi:DUF1540 domain-containing protein [Niameybacter massiliensis]|uniref:DUF1540 domain-containing protein n=1 Tax=Holtiella tumoricola TaxID=3018743 RepID=A0AA42IZL9_9FIRM|nr:MULTISPECIES: DUF1540 domain-containing protein [Lachnospirales]MDA3730430.1 DUF1540 domain-containing protein [Holtiella tumoricola]